MLVEFKGVPIEEIAKTMHHTCKTIQRYLSPDYSVEDGHYNARIPGKLAPYEAEVIKLRSEGMTYPNIHKIITEKGYKGSVASLRMFIQKERIRNEAHLSQQETCSDYQSKEYIQRRSLIQLIYKGLSDVKTITKTQYEQVLKTYPVITELYAAIKEFYEIIYVFLTIFLYLLKCPQSLILSALRAFCLCGKPHISRLIFLYFPCQSWLKSW